MPSRHAPYGRARYINLVKEMTFCEFRLRDQSTLLGFLWTLLHPVLLFLVLYGLFTKWMGNHVPSFPVYLLVGVVQWNYFIKGTSGGLQSVMQKSPLLTNFLFPREALVVASVLTNLLIHLLEIGVMLPFLMMFGAKLSFKWLLLPVPVVIETFIVLGVSLYLARLAVEYKDMVRVWEIVTMTGFFVTPVFFPLSIISPDKQKFLLLNPMTRLMEETRHFIVYDRWPSASVLGALALVAALLCGGGYIYFKRGESHFAEKFP